jgi:hypothetical protein
MSSTVRPDNLRAALDAKLAAALSRSVDLREADEPRATLHLSPREILGEFFHYLHDVYRIADTFGRSEAGELQFNAWYEQWTARLNDIDRALWKRLRPDRAGKERDDLIGVEISVPSDPAVTIREALPGAGTAVRKQLIRFAAYPNRAASDVCEHYLELARRFAQDFVRDHARFLPQNSDTVD